MPLRETLSTAWDHHNSRTNHGARWLVTDFAVLDGFEGHNSGLSITSLSSSARMASPAMMGCNLGESRLFHAGTGRRRRTSGRRPR
jgi:hypothetical protein